MTQDQIMQQALKLLDARMRATRPSRRPRRCETRRGDAYAGSVGSMPFLGSRSLAPRRSPALWTSPAASDPRRSSSKSRGGIIFATIAIWSSMPTQLFVQ